MAATEPGPRGEFGEFAHADQHAGRCERRPDYRSPMTDNYWVVGDIYTPFYHDCFCFQLGLVRDVQRYALILNDDGEQPEETSAGRSGET